jgi:hypothetical protein
MSCQRKQARPRGKGPVPPVPPIRPVKPQFSRGRIPGTPSAGCAGHDPELRFPDSPAEIAQAEAICRGCPDQPLCLSGVTKRRETYGIWGGTDFTVDHHQEHVA